MAAAHPTDCTRALCERVRNDLCDHAPKISPRRWSERAEMHFQKGQKGQKGLNLFRTARGLERSTLRQTAETPVDIGNASQTPTA